jgi:predicted phosphodiesterase
VGKIHSVDLPKKKPHVYHITSDWHAEFLHKPTYNILIDHALLYPKNERRLVINGDFADIPYGMKKNSNYQKWAKRADGCDEFFLPHWEQEAQLLNEYLDELQMVFSEIIILGGNHDQPRLDNIKDVVPHGYHHHFNFKSALGLEQRMIKWCDYNDWLDIGKISLTHGMAHGTTANNKHWMKSGARSVIFGHVHNLEVRSYHTRGDTTQTHSLPAMCGLNPCYIKSNETNWSNGFGILCVKPSGKFNYITYQVWDDELVLPTGKILRG